MRFRCLLVVGLLTFLPALRADGPSDNLPDKVRPIPPAGIALPPEEVQTLRSAAAELAAEIDALGRSLRPPLRDLLPDVEIYHKAVADALEFNEFYQRNQAKVARTLLQEGHERAQSLRAGKAPWTSTTGRVLRGYRSRIDGSAQPYGLIVPPSYRSDGARAHRLDIWCHGRGETLTELAFLAERRTSNGKFVPPHAFVLHPYGRYSNAYKFAGEIDVLEAIEHAQRHYRIDDDRVIMRGFSMGGAACWQFAVHYPDRWAAAAPGAGFSETPEFLRVFQNEKLTPTPYEKKLWQLYDCPGYCANLFNLPVVAYSGSKDRQKQAADVMAAALEKEGMHLVHLIGPGMGHDYHPVTRVELDRRIDRIAARGRDRLPATVRFTTYTLRYNRSFWVTVDALGKHWEKATVHATLVHPSHPVSVTTTNVEALTLAIGPGDCPLSLRGEPRVLLDDQEVRAAPVLSDRSWTAHFRRSAGKWHSTPSADSATLAKRHGLQGPIDDAFMDSFLMVRPTGKARHDKVGAWTQQEMEHALRHWRQQFRGRARVKDDRDVTPADIAAHHLILWGDPASNHLLARLADRLPIRWTETTISVGKQTFPAEHHIPALIYPNPLNPHRYVVVNSGFTFREYDYLNNARQVPRLPDHAVIDVRTPPSSRWPGRVAAAGFFDERWQLLPDEK